MTLRNAERSHSNTLAGGATDEVRLAGVGDRDRVRVRIVNLSSTRLWVRPGVDTVTEAEDGARVVLGGSELVLEVDATNGVGAQVALRAPVGLGSVDYCVELA